MEDTPKDAVFEPASTLIVEHLLITDNDTQEVLVNQRGSVVPSIASETDHNEDDGEATD